MLSEKLKQELKNRNFTSDNEGTKLEIFSYSQEETRITVHQRHAIIKIHLVCFNNITKDKTIEILAEDGSEQQIALVLANVDILLKNI